MNRKKTLSALFRGGRRARHSEGALSISPAEYRQHVKTDLILRPCPLRKRPFYEFLCTSRYRFHKRDFFTICSQISLKYSEVFAGRRNSIPCAAFINSMARMCSRLSITRKFSGIGSHTDMIFLTVGRNDRIARSRIAVHLILADHGCGGILGIIKPELNPDWQPKFRQPTQPHD